MSKILAWGECQAYARKYSDDSTKGTTWTKFDIPVSDSTSLETTEGDKTEATVEGGEIEAVRRAKNKYTLSFEERVGKDYSYKLTDKDGIVEGEFEVVLVPKENAGAPTLYIPKAYASITDSYTSADGVKIKYSFDALKNDLSFGQVVWGTAVEGDNGVTSFTAFKDSTKKNLLDAE